MKGTLSETPRDTESSKRKTEKVAKTCVKTHAQAFQQRVGGGMPKFKKEARKRYRNRLEEVEQGRMLKGALEPPISNVSVCCHILNFQIIHSKGRDSLKQFPIAKSPDYELVSVDLTVGAARDSSNAICFA